MRKALFIALFVPGLAQGTTDSLQWTCSALQSLGPHGPRVLLRDFALAVEDDVTTVWTAEERFTAVMNMVDFATSPPIMPDNPPVYDYSALARLSKKELALVRDLAQRYAHNEYSHRIRELETLRANVVDWIGRLTDYGTAVVRRIVW